MTDPSKIQIDESESFIEEAQRKRREARQRYIPWAVVAVALLLAAYFIVPRGARAIRSWQSRRAAARALALIESGKLNEAAAKTRDAIQLRFTEPQSWRAAARLLSRGGQPSDAIIWWKKVDAAKRLTMEDRRDYAASALAAGQLAIAAEQIDFLLADEETTKPADVLLAAQLSARRGDNARTREYAERALVDGYAQPEDILGAALLLFATTGRESPEYTSTWSHLVSLARGPESPVSLRALAVLAQQPAPIYPDRPGRGSSFSLALPGAAVLEDRILFGEIADRIEKNPAAQTADRLLALGLRVKEDPSHIEEYVAEAVKRFGKSSADDVAALAGWLQGLGRFETVLQLLPTERAVEQRELFLKRIDALTALGRWQEVEKLLTDDRFPLEPVLQHMYLAVVSAKLGQTTAAKNEWTRALASGDKADKLMILGSYAERNGELAIADAAYGKAIEITPDFRTPYAARLQVALAAGETAKAREVSAEIVKRWPNDQIARNEDAYLRLLLGAPAEEAEAIERDTAALVAREPWNWEARATLGLARLKLGRAGAALEAFPNGRPNGAPPGAQAIYVAANAANGWTEEAKEDARNLPRFSLLPEERALIAPLLTDSSP